MLPFVAGLMVGLALGLGVGVGEGGAPGQIEISSTKGPGGAGVAPAPPEALVEHPAVVQRFQAIVDELNRDLAQFERIKKWALLSKEFSVQSGELTPTQKIKRAAVETAYRDVIDGMYDAHPVVT